MKARKVITTITLETLSTDSVKGLLIQVAEQLHSETVHGNLRMEDGDQAKWDTEFKEVEF